MALRTPLFPILWPSISGDAQAALLAKCGAPFESPSFLTMAPATPGMRRGTTPTFWQYEGDLLAAAKALGLSLSRFPPALWVGIKNDLVVARLVNPGPAVWLALNDLSAATVSNLVNAINSLLS